MTTEKMTSYEILAKAEKYCFRTSASFAFFIFGLFLFLNSPEKLSMGEVRLLSIYFAVAGFAFFLFLFTFVLFTVQFYLKSKKEMKEEKLSDAIEDKIKKAVAAEIENLRSLEKE